MRLMILSELLLIAVAAIGQKPGVIPPADLQKRIPMTKLFHPTVPSSLQTPDFLFTSCKDTFCAVGKDKTGKRWRVILDPAIRGLWRLDQNGNRTYYFAGYTGGAGMAPGTWILSISFDEQGRPIPFYFMTQLGEYDEQGLKDLLILDGSGPVLLQQDWVVTGFTADGEQTGYFITSLYQQRGRYWYRADNQHGTKIFPIFEKFTALPGEQRQEVKDTASLKQWVADYGNDPKMGLRTQIVSVDRKGIHFGPELKCVMQDREIIVRDTISGREIASYDSKPQELLGELARTHSPVVLTGLKEWPETNSCTASVIWVTATQ